MVGSEPRRARRPERSGALTVSHPDLEWRETVQGRRPGDRFVRVATHKGFTRVRRGYLVPRPGTGQPTTGLGRTLQRLKHVVLGSPIPTARESHERLTNVKALAVFSSDALSSVAYATEEIMKVLVLVGAVVLIVLGNLRGIRESGSIFAVPTYVFVGLMYVLIGYGLYRLVLGGGMSYEPPPSARQPIGEAIGLFVLLRAFAQGCTAMTGTEAISNGVPAFKPPEWANARTTLVWMGVLLGSMFLGLSYLAVQLGVLPADDETVISQIGRTVFGAGPLWVALQIATALILILAANTSFADFPRLSSILARDRFLPRLFQFRGDRLAFTTGIVALAILSSVLLVIFNGSLDALIPLYAIGVFTSFTLSQAGMVVHWRRLRELGWRRSAVINGIGAVATALVTLVIAVTKFAEGAWLVILLIPLLIGMFWGIHHHYLRLERARKAETPLLVEEVAIRAVVPVADLGVPARQALAFARAMAPDDAHVVAVHVTDDVASAERLRREWEEWEPGVELLLVESPFRSLTGPLLAYIDALQETHPTDTITVVLPEFVPSRWWEHLLHNQTALRLKAALLFHPGVVVTNVPYHMALQPATT
jgi:amino acid transporter